MAADGNEPTKNSNLKAVTDAATAGVKEWARGAC